MTPIRKTTPLLKRELNDPIAWLIDGLEELDLPSGPIDVATFLGHVDALVKVLPEAKHVINLCTNRYYFLLALCAAVVKQQTSLLPPNKRPNSQSKLAADYPETYIIHDGKAELADLQEINLRTQGLRGKNAQVTIPQVSDDFLALISFTSGSTGQSKPNLKFFDTLTASTAINCRYMLPNSDSIFYHLATVPGQHMWGLETSVLMPMFANVCLVDSQPFFPADIVSHLQKLPEKRALITTPLHLKSLATVDSTQLKLENVLCATAPLSANLAAQIEERFQTRVQEVYGCSEVGSMALRTTATNHAWVPFAGLDFTTIESKTAVSANHLPAEVILEDLLEFASDGRFQLKGRQGDLVKVGGKRGSLLEINKVLLDFAGVRDGFAFMPVQQTNVPRVVAMVVYEEREDRAGLRQHLRQHLDSAFIPRPLLTVDQLPREENGKLAKQRVMALYADLTKDQGTS